MSKKRNKITAQQQIVFTCCGSVNRCCDLTRNDDLFTLRMWGESPWTGAENSAVRTAHHPVMLKRSRQGTYYQRGCQHQKKWLRESNIKGSGLVGGGGGLRNC